MFVTKNRTKRGFLIPLDVITAAKQGGINLQTLQNMVMHSTRFTHPQGNRRYNGFLFMVEGNRVTAFGRISTLPLVEGDPAVKTSTAAVSVDMAMSDCSYCKDTGVVSAFDECEKCSGVGCKYCDEGLIPSSTPCPMCSIKQEKTAS